MAFTYLCNLSLMSSIFFIFVIFSSLKPIVTSEPVVSSYIVHTDNQARPSQFSTQDDWYASMIASVIDQKVQSLSGPRIFYTYDVAFKGFAARLTDKEAENFMNMPEVISVFQDKATLKLDTTRSPDFLGLNHNYGLWPETNYGDDIVIGVVDSGIWPESGSFDDGGLGPVPSRWKGACEEGDRFNSSNCNKKLIGARFFLEGIKHYVSDDIVYHMSPRDDDGHGTHVASTAAGTGVANANTFGFASGTARGIASKARIAMYKACWPDCFWSDVFAGMEAAIKDGVDILSVSIGFPEQPYYENLMARAAFAAVKKNIFVCCSAGNDGPGMSSVHNAAPWITTVGSGSMDRSFPVQIQIGDKSFVGSSLYPGKIINKSYPLVNPGSCGFEKTVPNNVVGKIVVCSYGGVTESFEDGKLIHEAGGVGMIALNSVFDGEEIRAVPYTLPSVTMGYKGGLKILSYINSTRNPSVSFRIHNITVVGKDRAPIASSMSSRGPNPIAPEILKPDIIAPGSNILAAWPPNEAPTASPHDRRRVKFNILSGTSMACPHVAGVAALLRAAHPNWSPSAIRSALMTTATTIDNEDAPLARYDDMGQATPLSIGAGHINPQMASDPGLVYDADTSDYTKFLCSLNYTEKQMKAFVDAPNSCTGHAGAPGDLNYPSFSVVFKGDSTIQELKRTATNVGELLLEIYKVRVINFEAEKLTVSVKPQSLVFKKLDEKQSYIVNFKSNYSVDNSVGVVKQMVFGSILWESDRHSVRSPFAVMWQKS